MSEIVQWPAYAKAQFLRPRAKWLARGLVYAARIGSSLIEWPSGGVLTPTGTKVVVAPDGSLMRGFGATHGVASSDIVRTTCTTHATYRTYIARVIRFGGGGGTYGRVLDKNGGTNTELILIINDTGQNRLRFERNYTSTPAFIDVTWPAVGRPTTVAVTSNSSSQFSSSIAIYYNGVAQPAVANGDGSGTLRTSTEPFAIGNRPTDGLRNWDGYIGDVAIFDSILSLADINELADMRALWEVPRVFWNKTSVVAGTPTLSDLRAINVTGSSTQWSIDYTF